MEHTLVTDQEAAVLDGIRHTWKVGEGVTKAGQDLQGTAAKDKMLLEAGLLDHDRQNYYASLAENSEELKKLMPDIQELVAMYNRKRDFEDRAIADTETMVKMSEMIKTYFDQHQLEAKVHRIALSVDFLKRALQMWMEVNEIEDGHIPFEIEYEINNKFKETPVRLQADVSLQEDNSQLPEGYLLAYGPADEFN